MWPGKARATGDSLKNVGFLASLNRDNRSAGSRFLNQPSGLGLRIGGRRRHENLRLTFLALDPLAVQRFIAGDDFMTMRAFESDGVHDASVVWLNS